jgi:hypothetical protein
MTDESTPPEQEASPPRWQPLSATDRRVAGALIEKAKTTPNAYPMSLNAICTACNQKSNRAPVMELEPDDVEESLDRLRKLGAVGLIEGYGRVQKYRHYLYDWLGVDKVEIAVMAELLLRGAQTIGELRGRAARMEPIRDLGELQPVLASLKSKGLVIPLTSGGRGQIVTHALFSEKEMAGLKAQYGGTSPAPEVSPQAPPAASTSAPATATAPASQLPPQLGEALQRELRELRTQVAQMQNDLETLAATVERNEDEMRRLRDELGG